MGKEGCGRVGIEASQCSLGSLRRHDAKDQEGMWEEVGVLVDRGDRATSRCLGPGQAPTSKVSEKEGP